MTYWRIVHISLSPEVYRDGVPCPTRVDRRANSPMSRKLDHVSIEVEARVKGFGSLRSISPSHRGGSFTRRALSTELYKNA